MSEIVEVTQGMFESEVAQSLVPVLLNFTATWCGPCKAVYPVLVDVAAAIAERGKVFKVDIDECPDIAAQFQVSGVPTLVMLTNGVERERMMGGQTRGKLLAKFERYIADEQQ